MYVFTAWPPTMKPTDRLLYVVYFLNSQLKMNNLTVADLEASHPLPIRPKKTEPNVASLTLNSTPNMIVRFHNRNIRNEVIRKCKRLRGTRTSNEVIRKCKRLRGTRTSISGDLTSLDMPLLNRLKNDDKVSNLGRGMGKSSDYLRMVRSLWLSHFRHANVIKFPS